MNEVLPKTEKQLRLVRTVGGSEGASKPSGPESHHLVLSARKQYQLQLLQV